MHKCNYFLQINIHTYICRSSHLQNLETIDETASLIGDFVGTTTSTTNTITTAVQNLDNSIWHGADLLFGFTLFRVRSELVGHEMKCAGEPCTCRRVVGCAA